jgi:aspartate carbamoyltransferase regulatory subunit
LKGKAVAPSPNATSLFLPINERDRVRVVLKLIHNTISQKGIIKLDSRKMKIPKKVRLLSMVIPIAAGSNI